MSSAMVLALLEEGGGLRMPALVCTDHADVLDLPADSPDAGERTAAAFNPATPAAVLVRLAEDGDPLVRANAGVNGNLPRGDRVRLALHDPDPAVRAKVLWAMTTVRGREVIAGRRFFPNPRTGAEGDDIRAGCVTLKVPRPTRTRLARRPPADRRMPDAQGAGSDRYATCPLPA